ncbi:MAG TPA: YSC84-related protein [Xanthomonadales bacterium]|nr:YSC84-related protein [Xanthomonadales bacterium]
MRNFARIVITLSLLFCAGQLMAWEPDPNDKKQLEVQAAILDIKAKDPGIEAWFEGAAGYAVFPKVGKGGFVVGGAYGSGLVIAGEKVVGKTTISQVTVGFQIGGQAYAEFIFFRDEVALESFKRGNFEVGAQASAVVAKAGASADAAYNKGVAIFTNISGGVMAEASVGGQKFTYEAIQ